MFHKKQIVSIKAFKRERQKESTDIEWKFDLHIQLQSYHYSSWIVWPPNVWLLVIVYMCHRQTSFVLAHIVLLSKVWKDAEKCKHA